MNLETELLNFFNASPGETFNAKQIYAQTALKNHYSIEQIYQALHQLARDGKLIQETTSRFTLNVVGKVFEAVVEDVHLHLNCYEAWMDALAERVFIPFSNQYFLIVGDRIQVRVTEKQKKFSFGELVEWLDGERRSFVGKIIKEANRLFFVPDDRKVPWEYEIRSKVSKEDIGKKAFAQLVPNQYGEPELQIVKIIGKAGEHQTEIHSIIYDFGLITEFSEAAIKESESLSEVIPQEEYAKRRDFRSVPTVTIDPVDAKDFDDALSLRKLENGNYEVGIHIADVAYYVQKDSAIDQDAYLRGTSVYLVDRTLPMLPEKISNFLCSLRPNEDKLAFSVVVEMDAAGKVVQEWFGRTIIHSRKRFTYEEAQSILEAPQGEWADFLTTLNQLAYALRKQREKKGSINFETEEIRFQLDEHYRPVQIIPKVRKDAHKLIEDFMLLANQRVCRLIARNKKIPMVFRVHDQPQSDKLQDLKNFLETLGFHLDLGSDKAFRKSLNQITQKLEGTPQGDIVANVAIRSMAKAVYQPKNIGHYALAFDDYTHFTSPIRRYPDLMVHRILAQFLDNPRKIVYEEAQLEKMCKHCSNQEKKASDAERASIKYKLVEYASRYLGQTLEGTISGITNWGFYVQMLDIKAEGLVFMKSLKDDYYYYDEKNYCIIGRRTKKKFQLGDRVKVRILKTDIQQRNIDLELVSSEKYGSFSTQSARNKGKASARRRSKARKKS